MAVTIEAFFEQGMFRPLTPVEFDEGVRLEMTVRRVQAGRRFADRVLLPEFAALPPLAGDTTEHISADRDPR